jgi:hypothetical protein
MQSCAYGSRGMPMAASSLPFASTAVGRSAWTRRAKKSSVISGSTALLGVYVNVSARVFAAAAALRAELSCGCSDGLRNGAGVWAWQPGGAWARQPWGAWSH